MKTEIVQQLKINFEKDEKESIKKVITLIGNLIDIGYKHDYTCYEVNSIYRELSEFEDVMEFLIDLTCAGDIKLT